MWRWLQGIINSDAVIVQEEHALSRLVLHLEHEIERLSQERDYYRNQVIQEVPANIGVGEIGVSKAVDVKAGNVTLKRINTGRTRRKDFLEDLQNRLDAHAKASQDEETGTGD